MKLELNDDLIYLVRYGAAIDANDICAEIEKGHHDTGRPYSKDLKQFMQTALSKQVTIIEQCNDALSDIYTPIDTKPFYTYL